MKFWKGNRVDAEFDMPVREVASQFLAYARSEGVMAELLQGLPIERCVRWWMCSAEHFNSVWVDETGPDSFAELMDRIEDLVYGRVVVAEIDTSEQPTFSSDGPGYSIQHS